MPGVICSGPELNSLNTATFSPEIVLVIWNYYQYSRPGKPSRATILQHIEATYSFGHRQRIYSIFQAARYNSYYYNKICSYHSVVGFCHFGSPMGTDGNLTRNMMYSRIKETHYGSIYVAFSSRSSLNKFLGKKLMKEFEVAQFAEAL